MTSELHIHMNEEPIFLTFRLLFSSWNFLLPCWPSVPFLFLLFPCLAQTSAVPYFFIPRMSRSCSACDFFRPNYFSLFFIYLSRIFLHSLEQRHSPLPLGHCDVIGGGDQTEKQQLYWTLAVVLIWLHCFYLPVYLNECHMASLRQFGGISGT